MKILISDAFDPSLPDKLAAFGEVTDDKDRLPEVDVVLVRSKTKCRKDYIDSATNLRLIIRGGCVNEADMRAALESGRVRAYATDVFLSDPPADDSPLYDAPNVIMTPHIGASSRENMLRIGDVVVRILEDFAQQTA